VQEFSPEGCSATGRDPPQFQEELVGPALKAQPPQAEISISSRIASCTHEIGRQD